MALTKRELLRTGVEHQQALVKKLQDQKTMPPKKRKIPGGKNLLDDVTQDNMGMAIYNWLRSCRSFTEVTISFAKEPESFNCRVSKVFDFDGAGPKEIWETHPEGRKYLADRLADILNNHQAVKVTAKKDGIWLYEDVEKKFSPYAIVTEEDVADQQKLVEEVKQEMRESGEDPNTLTYDKLEVGQTRPSEAWEPYIEFIPKRKKEYGR